MTIIIRHGISDVGHTQHVFYCTRKA